MKVSASIPKKATLHIESLSVRYQEKNVLQDINFTLPYNNLTVFIGPNGCGKSTLLKSLSCVKKPTSGSVFLGDLNIHQAPAKLIAKHIALLSQSPSTSEDLSVYTLVSRGRYPHQNFFAIWRQEDEIAVQEALYVTKLQDLQHEPLRNLSGGQKQRAWIAMTLAQQTPILLLDEPTTYLDIAYQIELLNLCYKLYLQGRTLGLVLHDLNLALRYATYLIVMKDGKIFAKAPKKKLLLPNF